MTGPKRDYIPLKDRLAAALSYRLTEAERNDLRNRRASAEDIISLFDCDHNIPVRIGGSKDWWNINWLRTEEHVEKTRSDQQVIAKARRFERLERTGTKRTDAQKKRYRPIQSRGFMSKEERRSILEKHGRKPWSQPR